METPMGKGHEVSGGGSLPPPPASVPAANFAKFCLQRPASRPVYDDDFEVHLPGRGHTTFLVRVAGREFAATSGVAVVIHGGGFTGMSWAPAAGVMKRDCCVLAPDLRGHGLTSSSDTDIDIDTRNPSDGEDNDDDGVAHDTLMSLDSLTEDVMSLLVEIFSSGMLLQPHLPRRRRDEEQEQTPQRQPQQPLPAASPPTQRVGNSNPASSCSSSSNNCSASRGSDNGSDPVSGGPATTGALPPPQDSENENGGDTIINPTSGDASRATTTRVSNPAIPPEDAAAVPDGGGGISRTNSPVKLLLVGHSLGGSIAVRLAGAAEELQRRCRGAVEVAGVVAVDVVEGTALAVLDDMPEILRKIPRSFPSMEDAVRWHIKTGAVRNSGSAHTVVPSRFKIDEAQDGRVVWRTDLRATERHWRDWFEGMSRAFLELPMPKLLVVAGMDRLDTELTAAYMKGRFQLKLVYGCGHSVQEDQPDETAASIVNFAIRNSIFRRGAGGAAQGCRPVQEEEEMLRLKLARAREQAHRTRR